MPFTVKAFQGIGAIFTAQVVNNDGTPALNKYTGTEVISGYVWPGDNQPVTFSLSPTWNSGPLGLIDIPVPASATATVNPGPYELIVQLSDSSQALAYGFLNIESTPATMASDLVTIPYVRSALADAQLTQNQIDYLPYAIQAAAKFAKRFCGDRNFAQATYAHEFIPNYEGLVRLGQTPVNQVIRVQGARDSALTITQDGVAVSSSWVNWSYTGDFASGQVMTGLNLYSQSGGVTTTQNILFSSLAPPTVGSLAAAISGLTGPTWSVQSNGYGNWPVAELMGGEIAQGASVGRGASLDVYSQDLTNCRLHSQSTGLLYVGLQTNSTGLGPTWGPDWIAFDYPGLPPGVQSKIKVTYNAGFATIPSDVQMAVAELTKYLLARLKADFLKEKERLGDYEYTLRKVWPGMPDSVKQTLSHYRQMFA